MTKPDPTPVAPIETHTAELTRYLATLAVLALVTGLFQLTGDRSHAELALVGLLTYAGTSGPRMVAPTRAQATVASLLPVVLVIAAGSFLGGCGGAITATAIVKPSCAAVRLLHHTCSIVDPQPGETP